MLTRDVSLAVRTLREGKLVAFPTETVYGLGGDASNPRAVRLIFATKGRPADHPLIVHLADVSEISRWAQSIPEAAWELAEAFWPGPLTLILKRAPGVDDLVSGGQDTIGLRMPSHPVARELLARFGGGVAAPSANRFGRISPTRAEHVLQEFGDEALLVLEGGACEVGLESTIVNLSGDSAVVLRPGALTPSELARVLGYEPVFVNHSEVRAPGTLESHYAPHTACERVEVSRLPRRLEELLAQEARVGVLARLADLPTGVEVVRAPAEPQAYGRALYANLRELDNAKLDRILVEEVPDSPEWMAVADRLRRASLSASR